MRPSRPPIDGRIAVIGAGWYGCHIATDLIDAGAEVTVFEAAPTIFAAASGHNQNRLHQGFHYPRSHSTREQSLRGFHHFNKVYPHLSHEVPENYFAIAERDSLLDMETYLQVMDASGLRYERVDPAAVGLSSVTGALRCGERLIDTEAAREHFHAALASQLRLGHAVTTLATNGGTAIVDGERFDAAVVCTWGTFAPPPAWDLYYEPCVTLVYRGAQDQAAYTVMDGPFHSLYPLGQGLFTLTSVQHTPLTRTTNIAEARAQISGLSEARLGRLRQLVEADFSRFYPAFVKRLEFASFDFSIKTKLRDASDARQAAVLASGAVIHVFAGKIDAVFEATGEVEALLRARLQRPG